LHAQLVKIGQEFGKNIREDVRTIKLASVTDLDGPAPDFVEAHKPGSDGKIVISTDYPDYIPFMTYAQNDAARFELYRVFRQRGYPQNLDVLQRLLSRRYELAQLLGYRNWADYVTEDKMVKTEAAARAFVDKVAYVSEVRARVTMMSSWPACKRKSGGQGGR